MDSAYSVEIYRPAAGYDCTNGGVSSKADAAVLLREGVEPSKPAPEGVAYLRLDESRIIDGKPYLRAVPIGETRWVMFGGNFIWTSDSRFRNEVSERPIPVHDRVE